MGIEDLAKALGAAVMEAETSDNDVDGPKIHLTDEQIATRLREFSAQVLEPDPVRFQAGDILAHKMPSVSPTKFVTRPVVFDHYLEERANGYTPGIADTEALGSNAGATEHDCIVFHLREAGGKHRAIPMLADSRWWKPHPDFPRATQEKAHA